MKVGVIGAGTMGSGIAQAFAQTEGYEVYLCDINDEFAANGKKKIAKGFEKRVARGKMDQAKADAILAKITTGTKDICTDADLVVEAALEVMEVKQQTFKELQDIVPATCMFATNTSSLSITQIGAGLDRPVIGMHFFNPAPVMKLIEVIAGLNTPDEMVEKFIQNWNSVVKPNDEVYHLGDVMLNDTEKGIEALKKLNGKIHIIRGNHDTDQRAAAYLECPNVIDVQWATMIKYKRRMFYLTHFYAVAKTPMDGENKQGIIVLHGHTHQTTNFTNDNYFVYHVGVDSHNFFPVSIEEIIEDIGKKKQEYNLRKEK